MAQDVIYSFNEDTISGFREFKYSAPDLRFTGFLRDNQLVFVIDETIDKMSPNFRLIIDALPEEQNLLNPEVKWDRILEEQWGADLKNIRPKEKNKFKKLDPEYEGLSLYAALIKTPEDAETRGRIEAIRQKHSLINALRREEEAVLEYNKATQTLESSKQTLAKAKKSFENLSERLKRLEEDEAIDPDNFDEAKKERAVVSHGKYEVRMKRAERRIKRAQKRVLSSTNDLNVAREQIAYIKTLISNQNETLIAGKPTEATLEANSKQEILAAKELAMEKISQIRQTEEDALPKNPILTKLSDIKQKETLSAAQQKPAPVAKKPSQDFSFAPPVAPVKQDRQEPKAPPPIMKVARSEPQKSEPQAPAKEASAEIQNLLKETQAEAKPAPMPEPKTKPEIKEKTMENNNPQPARPQPIQQNPIGPAHKKPADPNATSKKKALFWFLIIILSCVGMFLILQEEKKKPATAEIIQEPAVIEEPLMVEEDVAVSEEDDMDEGDEEDVEEAPYAISYDNNKATIVPTEIAAEEEDSDDDAADEDESDDDDVSAEEEEEEEEEDEDEEISETETEIVMQDLQTTSDNKIEVDLSNARENYIKRVIGEKTTKETRLYRKPLASLEKTFFYKDTKERKSTIATIREMNRLWNTLRQASYLRYYENDTTLVSDVENNMAIAEAFFSDERYLKEYADSYQKTYTKLERNFCGRFGIRSKQLCSKMANHSKPKMLGRPRAKLNLLNQAYESERKEFN